MKYSFYKKIGLGAAGIAVLFLALFFAGSSVPLREPSPMVAATIFPLFDIVRNIAKGGIEAVLIAPPGASPHTFEVSVSLVKRLQGARTIFTIGHGLDSWAASVQNSVPGADIFTVDNGIALRTFSEGEEAGSIDPHYWLSVPNAKIIAKNIEAKLKEVDPARSSLYEENTRRYLEELDEADKEMREILAGEKGVGLVTMHDAWFYFAKEYGLSIIATFEPFPGQEPTQKYLIELAEKIKEHNVKILFSEPQLSSGSLEPFLGDYGISLAVLDPEGSKISGSYIELMRYNARTIHEAYR